MNKGKKVHSSRFIIVCGNLFNIFLYIFFIQLKYFILLLILMHLCIMVITFVYRVLLQSYIQTALCILLTYFTPLERFYATESAKVIEVPIGTTNVYNSATWSEKKKGPSVGGDAFKDVRTMSVVSDKQRQAGSSGSAPATPQGNNLPPAVPPPSISRNPLRGSKCNSLHCDYSHTHSTIPPLTLLFRTCFRLLILTLGFAEYAENKRALYSRRSN